MTRIVKTTLGMTTYKLSIGLVLVVGVVIAWVLGRVKF